MPSGWRSGRRGTADQVRSRHTHVHRPHRPSGDRGARSMIGDVASRSTTPSGSTRAGTSDGSTWPRCRSPTRSTSILCWVKTAFRSRAASPRLAPSGSVASVESSASTWRPGRSPTSSRSAGSRSGPCSGGAPSGSRTRNPMGCHGSMWRHAKSPRASASRVSRRRRYQTATSSGSRRTWLDGVGSRRWSPLNDQRDRPDGKPSYLESPRPQGGHREEHENTARHRHRHRPARGLGGRRRRAGRDSRR